ncbi:MAG: Gfo/Idh/MocA family oxidoreductase, partial [Armatimonadetes bacterium]|nr:Gfo/Idh/MocA family oxidoreductase [Armatimonadota bacterium]
MSVSLAFVGLKGHYYVVTEALADLPEVRVVAGADDSPEALKRVSHFPGTTPETKTYLDYRELLEQHSPDIVVEAGTDRDRADIITACAERGIHVICEKPLAMDLEGLDRVRSAMAKSRIRCSALLTMRCEPSYLAMRESVARGTVG